MAVTPLFGMREGKKGSDGKREKERKVRRRRTETKWHPVKLKKMVRWTELNLSATLSEMKGDFDKIISFHLSLSSSPHSFAVYIVFTHLHFIWLLFSLLPFCVWSPVCCLFFFFPEWKKRKRRRINLHEVSLFIIKSAGVHKKKKNNRVKFNILPHSPGAGKLKI